MYMNKQKGFGIVIIPVVGVVILIVFIMLYRIPTKDVNIEGFDDTKSVLEQHIDLVEQAESAKNLIEDKNIIE